MCVLSSLSKVLALCFAVAVLEGFDIQALGVAAPQLAPAFGLSPEQVGWLFSISNIGLLIGAVGGGRAADIWGRKRILLLSVLTFSIGTLWVGLSQAYAAFFLARFLSGLGFGAALPNMMALAVEVSDAHRRGRAAAAIFCGMPLGGGSVALLTQLLPAEAGWRVLFVIGGLLPLLVAGVLQVYLPDTHRQARDGSNTLRVKSALFGDGRGWRTLLLWAAFLPAFLILYLLLNWLPMLVTAKGFAKAVAPQASLVFNYASVIGALSVGVWVDRFGARWVITACYAALAMALYGLAQVHAFGAVLATVGVVGFTLMGANFALYGLAAAQYPLQGRGTGSGAAVGVGRLGSVVGPLLAGLLLGAGMPADRLISWLIPGALLAGLAIVFLRSAAVED